ncbi:MAG TPA: hypothetical protein VM328_08560 [Fimbriimonadaceae bacterium]|nr:hypothetical protein [Fimbriimonadaceae bacterium]
MNCAEAKQLKGSCVAVTWSDRRGEIRMEVVDVLDIAFMPMYGPCLITSAGDISLHRVVSAQPADQLRAA